MPQTTKRRISLLFVFFTFQLLLNVTYTNAAVIRRDKREIDVNATRLTTSNNEVDSATVTTEEDVETSLFGTASSGDVFTTGKLMADAIVTDVSEGKKTVSTLTGHTIDENSLGFTSDSEEPYSGSEDENTNGGEDVVVSTINVDEKTTTALTFEGGKTALNEETSTVEGATLQSDNTNRSDTPFTTSSGPENSKTDEDTPQSTVQTDDRRGFEVTIGSVSTSVGTTSTVDVGTIQSTVSADETTALRQVTEDNSTSQVTFSTDANQDKTTEESTTLLPQEVTNVSTEPSFTDIVTSERREDLTVGDLNFASTTDLGVPNQTSEDNLMTNSSTPSILEDGNKSVTSTIQSDETTIILTSTETSDESPNQTTLYASPLLQDPSTMQEIKNSTPSSAEKRGKFIDDNYTSLNELRLPNTSDVWALAGMKSTGKMKSSELQNSVETSDEKAVNNSMVTKNLLDWSRVMMSTDRMESETTAEISDVAEITTTEVSAVQATTEVRLLQENEVISTINAPTDVNLTDRIDFQDEAVLKKNEVDSKTLAKFETTTSLSGNDEISTPERFTMDDTSMPEVDDILSTTKSSLVLLKGRDDAFIEDNQVEGDSVEEKPPPPTTSTTTTPLPNSVTMKSETTTSPVNNETTEEENTDTILASTLSLLDFTTSMPFLTSTTMATTNTPSIALNMGGRTNERPNMASTPTLSQLSPAEATVETATSTTTTTPVPAVTVMAATTETQTTESHTPAIISNDTMTQKSNNYNNYEVVNETTTKSADNSSIEAYEASTRVAPNWVASSAESSTTEVDRLDDFDVTTASNFYNNNAYEIATPQPSTTVASTLTFAPTTITALITTSGSSGGISTSTEDLDHIDLIHNISDTAEASIESNVIDPLHAGEASTTTSTTATARTTESSQENMRTQSTVREGVDSSSTTTTTVGYDDSTTTLQSISTKKEDVYAIVPTIESGFHVPKLVDTSSTISGELATGGGGQPMDGSDGQETDVNVIIAISVSVVGIVALILLVAFLYVMRKRQKQMSYGQRCRPVSLDAYSLDNVSVYNSVRRKGAALRASKRSYGNVAFDDPSLRHNVLGTHELAKYVEKKSSIWDEFKDVPQIIARADEVPAGCEDKNRYANVIPLPETRVILQQQNGDEKSEYINANYVRGPKDTTNYYIACQAPLETTVIDFWRMIWEQNSRVIIMATDLIENGIDKCAEYLPPSVTLDNHTVFGDFQVTLKNREVKEKYAISTLMLKNTATEESREITHYWYQWPESGVPTDEAAIIAMLLEARSSLKLYTIEQSDTKIETIITEENPSTKSEINGNVTSEKLKPPPKEQGPLTIHCSPGTGRTGTILACDIAMRCLEEPKRCVDIPQIVYSVRRGRASAVQTKEQYEFIYKVTHMYATKISNLNNDN